MKLRNKIISLMLSGVLVVSMVPFTAFAAQGSLGNINIENAVAAAGKKDDKAAEKKDSDQKEKKEESTSSKKSKAAADIAIDKISSILEDAAIPDKLLKKITEMGMELFFKHVVDVVFDTNYGSPEDKQTKMLRMMQEMQEQLNRIEKTTDQAFIRVKQASLETPLNNFLKDLSDVKNCSNDLADHYKRAVSIEDKNQRDEAIEQFKKGNLERLRTLAIKLNNLFDASSSVVQGRSSQDIISIYDQLMAESYNFANGVPYEQRKQFRSSVASIWIYGALIVSVLDHGLTEGFYTSQMNALYTNGKKLNLLINVSHELKPADVEKINDDGTRSVYCYTLGKFVRLIDGNWRNGWRRALRDDSETRTCSMIKGLGTYAEDEVASPFGNVWHINFKSETCKHPFGDRYVTTDLLKRIYTKIPQGMTLYDEFVAHKLATNKDGKQLYNFEKYLKKGMMVGSENFTHNYVFNTHKFMMDTSSVNGGQGTTFNKDNEVLRVLVTSDGSILFKCYNLNVFTQVDPAFLFALEYK